MDAAEDQVAALAGGANLEVTVAVVKGDNTLLAARLEVGIDD